MVSKVSPIILSLRSRNYFSLFNHVFVRQLEDTLRKKGYKVVKVGYLRLFSESEKTIRSILTNLDDKTVLIMDGIFIYGGFGKLIELLRDKKVIFLTSIPLSYLEKYDVKSMLYGVGDLEIISVDNDKGQLRDVTILYGKGSEINSVDVEKILNEIKEKRGTRIRPPIIILTKKLSTSKEFAKSLSKKLRLKYKIVTGSQTRYDKLPSRILAGAFGVLGYLPLANTVIIGRRINIFEALEIIYRSRGSIISLYDWELPRKIKLMTRNIAEKKHPEPEPYIHTRISKCILTPEGDIICDIQITRYVRKLFMERKPSLNQVLRLLGFSRKFIKFLYSNIECVEKIVFADISNLYRSIKQGVFDDIKEYLIANYILEEESRRDGINNEYTQFLDLLELNNILKKIMRYATAYAGLNVYMKWVEYGYRLCKLAGITPTVAEIKYIVENKKVLLKNELYVSRHPIILVDANSYEPIKEALTLVDEISFYTLTPIVEKISLKRTFPSEISQLLSNLGIDIKKTIIYIVVSKTNYLRKRERFEELIKTLQSMGCIVSFNVIPPYFIYLGKIRNKISPRVVFYYWISQLTKSGDYPRSFEILASRSAKFLENIVKNIKILLNNRYTIIFKTNIKIPSDDVGLALAIKYEKPLTCIAVKNPYIDTYLLKCFSKDNHVLWIIYNELKKLHLKAEIEEYKGTSVWRLTTSVPADTLNDVINKLGTIKTPIYSKIMLHDIRLPKYIYQVMF